MKTYYKSSLRVLLIAFAVNCMAMEASSQGGTIQFGIDNNSPTGSSGCPGSEVWYTLVWSTTYNVTSVSFSPTGSYTHQGTTDGSNGTTSWKIYKVLWTSSGSVSVNFLNGGTPESRGPSSFTMTGTNPGTISLSGPTTMCAGSSQTSGTIDITGNSGAVTYWSCTSGCSTVNDDGWTQMGSAAYTNLAVNTSFRTKHISSCAPYTFYSNIVNTTVEALPTDILVNGPAGVCNSNQNAKIVLNYGESGVKYRLFKNNVDTNLEITGPGPVEVGGRIEFTNQGSGEYHVIATKGSCPLRMSGTPNVIALSPAPFYVNTSPVQPISICPGTQVAFEAINGTGLQWSSTINDLSVPQQSASSFTIVPAATATYSVYGYETNCGQSVNASVLVTVKPVPNFSNQTATICSGQSTNLQLSSADGTTFEWSASAPSAVSGSANSTSPLANNLYIQQQLTSTAITSQDVVYSIVPTLNGCVGTTRTATVSVKPTPQITVTNKKVFSAQDFIFDLAPTVPNSIVAWTLTGASGVNTVPTGSTSNGLVNGNVTTSAQADGTITYVLEPSFNGCTGTTKNIVVTVFVRPVILASINPMIKGGGASVLTTNPVLAPGIGTWFRDDVSVSTATQISTRIPGKYKVMLSRDGVTGETLVLNLLSSISGQNLNYVITDVVQKPGVTDAAKVTFLRIDSVSQQVEYIDGLGRPMQTVVTEGSPTKKDVIRPNVYDAFGRSYKEFLPVTTGNTGAYQNVITTGDVYSPTGTSNFYSGGAPKVAEDNAPYSKSIYDGSPLNRVTKRGSPGTDWQPEGNNSVQLDYLYNNSIANDPLSVYLFKYNQAGGTITRATLLDGYYPDNSLMATKTTDEDNNHVIEFTDKEGRVVCRKVWVTGTTYASTYYIFDDFGNLAVVLPPEAVTRITN
jgi:Domain of unknown function (DUF6443)/PKD-like domain